MSEKKFTVREFKKYLDSQGSFGDAVYFLSEERIIKANEDEMED